jgi:hypothetical protein
MRAMVAFCSKGLTSPSPLIAGPDSDAAAPAPLDSDVVNRVFVLEVVNP